VSHNLGLGQVLELAASLGRLPREVVVWGIEIGAAAPSGELSFPVREALPELVERIRSDLDHA